MNADARFRSFVDRQNRPIPADEALDWDRERDEWLAHLDALYGFVADALDPYVSGGAIALHASTIDLNEENIGVYSAKRLMIAIGSQEIALTPVGTLLIGSKGRVDVRGNAGIARLLLVDGASTDAVSTIRVTITRPGGEAEPEQPPRPTRTPDWTWKIAGRPPQTRYSELNKDTLFEMLMEVSGG